MSEKRTLTIKDWHGSSSINFQVGTFMLMEKVRQGKRTERLTIWRKPDQFSSRLGMMAELNKRNRTLSWGFNEMSLTIENFSDQGVFVSIKTISFSGIAVENSKLVNDEEELTFVFNRKGEFCLGKC